MTVEFAFVSESVVALLTVSMSFWLLVILVSTSDLIFSAISLLSVIMLADSNSSLDACLN